MPVLSPAERPARNDHGLDLTPARTGERLVTAVATPAEGLDPLWRRLAASGCSGAACGPTPEARRAWALATFPCDACASCGVC